MSFATWIARGILNLDFGTATQEIRPCEILTSGRERSSRSHQ